MLPFHCPPSTRMKQGVRAGEMAAVPGWTRNRGSGLGLENSGKEMSTVDLGLTPIPKLK